MTESTAYKKMKNSGIEWVGEVPIHWNVRTLYQLASQVRQKNSDLLEENLLSLSYGKIKRKDINSSDGLLPASFEGYNIIEAGDIVLRLTDLQNDHTSLRVGHVTERGIITSAYTTLRPLEKKHSEYLYYLLHTFDLKKGFYGMGSGVRQGLNYKEVKEIRVVMPEQEEQDAIVAYLDEQCAKIDELIVEAKATIEEYKQWKSSVIFEAVTKGLDPDVRTKDSGVEWVEKIPYNWQLKPIKHIVIKRDSGAWGDESQNNDNDRICMRIADFDFDKGKFKNLDESFFTKRNYKQNQIEKLTLKYGDILIEKSGGGEKTPVGRAVLFNLNFKALFANFMDRIRVDTSEILPEFAVYYWRAMYYRTVTTAYIKQTTGIQNLNITSLLEKEKVLLPRINEQSEIVIYLDTRCKKIDALIEEKESLVYDLEAYKKSLIYEAVTGKRKVV